MKQHTNLLQLKGWVTIFVASCLFFVFTSCEKEDSPLKESKKTQIQPQTQSQVPQEIIDKLKKAGFDTTQGLKKYENGYLVEYDILLTEEQIDELAANANSAPNQRTEHYRTTNLVTGTPRVLQIYIDEGFGTYMVESFNRALRRYNQENLSLTFERTTNATDADIRILSFYQESYVLGYSAGFPTGGNPASPIGLNTYYYNNSTARPDAALAIAHEIGHAIGFRHTDYMDKTFSCGLGGGSEGDDGVGVIHIPETPKDPSEASWMLACSDGTDRPFTGNDVLALVNVYGLSYWDQVGGKAKDIAVGPGGTAYKIGTDPTNGGYEIFKLTNNGWTQIPGGAVKIAVGPGDVPWIITDNKIAYKRIGGDWQAMISGVTDLSVGADGSVYLIGDDVKNGGYEIIRLRTNGWDIIPGGAVRIAVSPDGTPWIVNNEKNIFRRVDGNWQQVTGSARDIAFSSSGSVFTIGTIETDGGYKIRRRDSGDWVSLPGHGGLKVSAGPRNVPWKIDDEGNTFKKRYVQKF